MTLEKRRTYIIQVSYPYVETFENMMRMNDHMCSVFGHTDGSFNDAWVEGIPINLGTWNKSGEFRGSTNYSGEATRYAMTIETKEK